MRIIHIRTPEQQEENNHQVEQRSEQEQQDQHDRNNTKKRTRTKTRTSTRLRDHGQHCMYTFWFKMCCYPNHCLAQQKEHDKPNKQCLVLELDAHFSLRK